MSQNDDLISRKKAINVLNTMPSFLDPYGEEMISKHGAKIRLEFLESAQPEPMERIYKIGYADGYHKAEKDYFERTEKDRDDAFKAGVEIEKAKRKVGRWIDGSIPTYAVCSECGYQERYADENNYCPNCGADMRGK